jgi:AcrR family transcriptional regulator
MPRRPNPARAHELVEAIAAYVLANGIADLSLRDIAAALNISTYSLVYHFGSKQGMIAAVMARIEERQRELTGAWGVEPGGASIAALMRRYWQEWCLPAELAPYHRLFYETYALTLQQPERFPGFLERGALPWLPAIRTVAQRAGLGDTDANLVAWWACSSVLGALFILLGTGDKDAATRAVYAAAGAIDTFVHRMTPADPS